MAVRLSQANVGSNENGAVLMMSLQTRLGDLVQGWVVVLVGAGTVCYMGGHGWLPM